MAANLEEIRQDMRGLQHFRLSSMFIKQIEPESSFKPVKKALVKVGGILTNVIKFKSGKKMEDEMDFAAACEIIITKFEKMNSVHARNKLIYSGALQALKEALQNKKVIVSFYGACNVGKSSVLNCIMGDRYLPSSRKVETAVSVYIQFQTSKSQVQEMPIDSVLCHESSPTSVAKGVTEVLKYLTEKNKESRILQSIEDATDTCTLVLNQSLMNNSAKNPTFLLLDTPGCNEYSEGQILKSIENAKHNSSAFVFVTTLDTYQERIFTETIKKIKETNPGIIHQRRLTIVINKMDSALLGSYEEKGYESTEIIEMVATHFSSVLGITKSDLISKSIILMSSSWALHARMLKKNPNDKELIKVTGKDMQDLCSIEKFKLNSDHEYSINEKIDLLERFSNIQEMEKRLISMAECAHNIWKQKMYSDICYQMVTTLKDLEKRKSSLRNEISDIERTTINLHEVIVLIKNFYQGIQRETSKCRKGKVKELPIWKDFKDACQEDMQKESNILATLLNEEEESLEAFKATTSNKMTKQVYTSDDLSKDLNNWLTRFSGKIDILLTSSENFSNLYQVYTEKTLKYHAEALNLQNRLRSTVTVHSATKLPERPHITPPKLTGPKFHLKVKIPAVRSIFKKFLIKVKQLFTKDHIPDSYEIILKDDKVCDDYSDSWANISYRDSSMDNECLSITSEMENNRKSNSSKIEMKQFSSSEFDDVFASETTSHTEPLSHQSNLHKYVPESEPHDDEYIGATSVVEPRDDKIDYGMPVEPKPTYQGKLCEESKTTIEVTNIDQENLIKGFKSTPRSSNSVMDNFSAEFWGEYEQRKEPVLVPMKSFEEMGLNPLNDKQKKSEDSVAVSDGTAQLLQPEESKVKKDILNTGDENISLSESQMRKESAATSKDKYIYKRWTPELEQLKVDVSTRIKKEILDFFQATDKNIIKKYCFMYYSTVSTMPTKLEEFAGDEINFCVVYLKTMWLSLKESREALQLLDKQEKKLFKMKVKFQEKLTHANKS